MHVARRERRWSGWRSTTALWAWCPCIWRHGHIGGHRWRHRPRRRNRREGTGRWQACTETGWIESFHVVPVNKVRLLNWFNIIFHLSQTMLLLCNCISISSAAMLTLGKQHCPRLKSNQCHSQPADKICRAAHSHIQQDPTSSQCQ